MKKKVKNLFADIFNAAERILRLDLKYLIKSNFWLSSSRIISVAIGFLLTISFANLLDQNQFGIYKYVLSIASIVSIFSLNGIGTAVTKAAAQGDEGVTRYIFKENIKWSIPASIITFLISIYYLINGNTIISSGLLLVALSNPFMNSFVLAKSILYGKSDFKTSAIYSIPRSFIPTLSIMAVLFFTQSVLAVLLTYFVMNFLLAYIIYKKVLKKHNVINNQKSLDSTLKYSKELSVLGFFLQGVNQLDNFLVWHFSGAANLAVYTFAFAPVRELKNFSENFFPIIFPKLATKSVAQVKETLPLRILQMTLVSVVIMLFYILLSPLMYKYIFPQYISSTTLSQLFALTFIFQAKGLIETFLIAHGEVKLRYIVISTTQIIRFILIVVLIPIYGIVGAIGALIASEFISAILLIYAYKKMK